MNSHIRLLPSALSPRVLVNVHVLDERSAGGGRLQVSCNRFAQRGEVGQVMTDVRQAGGDGIAKHVAVVRIQVDRVLGGEEVLRVVHQVHGVLAK